MSDATEHNYWVFSNKAEGTYGDTMWDMREILRTNRYSLDRSERNRARIRPGDAVYMRVYGESFIGRFTVDGEWERHPEASEENHGFFPMRDVDLWSRSLPQTLILRDLSNGDVRSRVVSITRDDGIRIETAQAVYERLGFGGADGDVVVLEKGLEEAIKPSLSQLGLALAHPDIQQQLSMGPGVGRSDLICRDRDGNLVVVELKRGMTSDETVGQTLAYVGWLRENVAEPGQEVHGWIVAGDYDERLRLAAKAAGIRLLLVRLG